MRLSVELSIQEKGFTQIDKGYLRDSHIELEDLLKWTKTQLIVISDRVLLEEQSHGFDLHPVTLVDGKKDKSILDVKPLGQIEFISHQDLGVVLLDAYEALLELSKVKTGLYKDSHYVFLNGQQVATNLVSLQAWLLEPPSIKTNDVVRIVNIQPYGRRLELLGVTSTRSKIKTRERKRKGAPTGTFLKQPNGAYQLTYRRLQSKYKNNVKISFNFLPGSSFGFTDRKKAHHFKTGRKGEKIDNGRTYLYPSLVFKIGEGLL